MCRSVYKDSWLTAMMVVLCWAVVSEDSSIHLWDQVRFIDWASSIWQHIELSYRVNPLDMLSLITGDENLLWFGTDESDSSFLACLFSETGPEELHAQIISPPGHLCGIAFWICMRACNSICLTCTRMVTCSYGLQQLLGSKVMGKKLHQRPPPKPLKSRIIETFWEKYGRRPPAERMTVLQNHIVDAWILKVVLALAVVIYVNTLHAGYVSKDSYITVSSLLFFPSFSPDQQLSPSSDCSRVQFAVEV